MRADLNKQLCERERRGSSNKYKAVRRSKKFASKDDERTGELQREGMKFRYGYDTKDFSENLTPLYGAVRKALGRPYAKFYSELSETFDKRSVVNQHILQHLDQYLVRKDLYVGEDGELMVHRKYTGPDVPLREDSSIEFYVDPRDDIIKRNRAKSIRQHQRERAERLAREEAEHFRKLDDGNELHKIGDVWFHFEMRPAPGGRFVYEKPKNQELFKPRYEIQPRSWERLKFYERKQFGVKRFIGESALDLLTGKVVFTEAGEEPVLYHAVKRSASRAMLKKAGIRN